MDVGDEEKRRAERRLVCVLENGAVWGRNIVGCWISFRERRRNVGGGIRIASRLDEITKSSSTSAIGTERSGLGSVSSCGASAVSAAKAETSGEGQRSINRGVGNSKLFFRN